MAGTDALFWPLSLFGVLRVPREFAPSERRWAIAAVCVDDVTSLGKVASS